MDIAVPAHDHDASQLQSSTLFVDTSCSGDKLQGLAAPLHSAILGRLTAGDQDQEVKDAAISAMATELALLGDVLSSKLPDTLQVGATAKSICCGKGDLPKHDMLAAWLRPYRQCCTAAC